jgi:hypothetical protein
MCQSDIQLMKAMPNSVCRFLEPRLPSSISGQLQLVIDCIMDLSYLASGALVERHIVKVHRYVAETRVAIYQLIIAKVAVLLLPLFVVMTTYVLYFCMSSHVK